MTLDKRMKGRRSRIDLESYNHQMGSTVRGSKRHKKAELRRRDPCFMYALSANSVGWSAERMTVGDCRNDRSGAQVKIPIRTTDD